MTPKCPENGFHGGKRDKNPLFRVGRPPIEGLPDSSNTRYLKNALGRNLQEIMAKKLLGVKGSTLGHCGPVRNREVISDGCSKLIDMGYELLSYPPCSIGLATFYLYLHQNLKKS